MSDYGHILDREGILERLHRGQIFLTGSWDTSCLRASAYDLRMSEDLIVVPEGNKYPTGRFYKRGERRTTDVILHPGDVAFVSTLEKICMPWDISGSVGHKFSLASRGLIVLTGMFIDPGFGLEPKDDDNWVSAEDRRLHFLIANVGSTEVALRPGVERIAAIQFTKIKEVTEKRIVYSVGFQAIEQEYLSAQNSSDVGLVFFRNMADLKENFQDLRKEIIDFKARVHNFEQRLLAIESGSNQIVMFGLYLICVTLLGTSIAITLGSIQNNALSSRLLHTVNMLDLHWRGAIVFLLIVITIFWGTWKIFSKIFQFYRRYKHNTLL